MNSKQFTLYILFTLIVIYVGIVFIPTFHQQPVTPYNKQIDSLKTLININNERQKLLYVRVQNLKDSIVYIDSQLVINQNRLNKLKKEYDDKINNISKYSVNELTEFFTNRYK
jgi:hypothetical protein